MKNQDSLLFELIKSYPDKDWRDRIIAGNRAIPVSYLINDNKYALEDILINPNITIQEAKLILSKMTSLDYPRITIARLIKFFGILRTFNILFKWKKEFVKYIPDYEFCQDQIIYNDGSNAAKIYPDIDEVCRSISYFKIRIRMKSVAKPFIYSNPSVTLDIIKSDPWLNEDIDYEYLSKNPNLNFKYLSDNLNKKWDYNLLSINYSFTIGEIIDSINIINWNINVSVSRLDITLDIIKLLIEIGKLDIQKFPSLFDHGIFTNPAINPNDIIEISKYYKNYYFLNPVIAKEDILRGFDGVSGLDDVNFITDICYNEFNYSPKIQQLDKIRNEREIRKKNLSLLLPLIIPLNEIIVSYLIL